MKKFTSKLVAKHMPLIKSIAREYHRPGVDIDDLVQVGRLGLWLACKSWSSEAGAKFCSVASLRIRDQMRTALAQQGLGRNRKLGLVTYSYDTDRRGERGIGPHEGQLLSELIGEGPRQEDDFFELEAVARLRLVLARAAPEDQALVGLWLKCQEQFHPNSRSGGGVLEMSRQLRVPYATMHGRVLSLLGRLREAAA